MVIILEEWGGLNSPQIEKNAILLKKTAKMFAGSKKVPTFALAFENKT